jgi:septum formation protein
MLKSLSGREHQVITGICLSGPALLSDNDYIVHTDAAISFVRFHDLAPDTLKTYLESEEWKGKAGAYAIQGRGSQLVEKLTGDFENVVGLPMILLKNAIAQYFSHCILQP